MFGGRRGRPECEISCHGRKTVCLFVCFFVSLFAWLVFCGVRSVTFQGERSHELGHAEGTERLPTTPIVEVINVIFLPCL